MCRRGDVPVGREDERMSEQIQMPSVGVGGEPCASCGTPLAADQRYCLGCGKRRGAARLPYERYLAPAARSNGAGTDASRAGGERPNEVSPLGAVLGIALLAGMLLIGVLLGRGEGDNAQSPAVVQTTAATTTPQLGVVEPADEPPVSEWPAGTDGFTVELGTLAKSGTTAADVDATKADLQSRGASDLGVLDSDLYPSLPAGNYVIYSGVHEERADAERARDDLGGSFPDATVIKVSQKQPATAGPRPRKGEAAAPASPTEEEAAPASPSGDITPPPIGDGGAVGPADPTAPPTPDAASQDSDTQEGQ